MALPTTRAEFKEYILRRLGFPVQEINIDDMQIEDRIDDALSYYQEYHFDGVEKIYMKHLITSTDKTNKYIDIPDEIIGIVRVLDGNPNTTTGTGMFSYQYQLYLNDLYNFTSTSLVPYVIAMQYIELFNNIFAGESGIQFNRRTDKLYINWDWNVINEGKFIVIDCYRVLDPAVYNEIWSDRWLLRYATAQVKKQFGTNLKKHSGVAILGGITFNGQTIYDEAESEIKKLEDEMLVSYSIPATDMIG
jgi:hypothetical protein